MDNAEFRDLENRLAKVPMPEIVARNEDMSNTGKLMVCRQEDGDLIVTVIPPMDARRLMASVEFCTIGAGGGRSWRTRVALRLLALAMQADNAADEKSTM